MTKHLGLAVGLFAGLVVGVSSCREPCTADSCAGCCDARGECLAGTEPAACGRRGEVCSACNGACVRSVCVGGVADAGADGGMTMGSDAGCLVGRCGTFVCNLVSGQCEAPGACDALQPQPAGCGAGHFCASGTCADVPRPMCSNFPATFRWNPALQFGPVVTAARMVSFGLVDAGCPTGSLKRGVAELSAYDFMSRFLPDGGGPRLFLYRENATLTEVRAEQLVGSTPSNGGANTVLQVAVCAADGTAMLTQGFAFENGNGVCVTFR